MTSSSSYKCMVVIPKEEYERLKSNTQSGMSTSVAEGARENTVTNVSNEGGVILVNSTGNGAPDRVNGPTSAQSGEGVNGHKTASSAKSSSKVKKESSEVNKGTSTGSQYQAGRFARIKGKAAAVSRGAARQNAEEGKKSLSDGAQEAPSEEKEKESVIFNELGRPIVKGRRRIHTLKRRRGELEEEDISALPRKRQREEMLQQVIDDKLAKLQGRMPMSPFTKGSLTGRPIARVLQAPIFKPDELQPMDVDNEQEGVQPALVEVEGREEPLPMEAEDYPDEMTQSTKSFPLVRYRRGKKRPNLTEDVEEKPAEKRRWLGEYSNTDADVSYPDDGEEEDSPKSIPYEERPAIAYEERPAMAHEEERPALTHERRGQKRLNYSDKPSLTYQAKKRLLYDKLSNNDSGVRASQKRKALTFDEENISSKKALVSRKRAREGGEMGNEKKKLRQEAQKRRYPYKDDDYQIQSKRRYEDDNNYELW